MAINLTVVIDNEEAVRKFRELQRTAKTVTSSVVTDADRMDMAMHKFMSTLGQLGVGVSLIGFAKQVAQTRGEFQQLEVAFTTLLQSKEKADALMAQMVDLAARTPFDLQGVADGARQLLAYGFAAEDITDTLTRLGNVAAGLGLPLERLTYLYGTTAVQGRLYARDMLQFTSSGIPVLQEMAKMYGKTTEEINEMVSAGKIGFEDVKKVIENMTNSGGQFYNLMQEQSKTITGLISNLGDAIDNMFNNIGKSTEGIIAGSIKGAIYLVENYQKILDILIPLIAAYGAYKAALMGIAAFNRVKNITAATKAILQQTQMLRRATQAQILFNKAVKANPLGLFLSLITGIITALATFSKKARTTADILNDLQTATQDYANINADKIDALADEYDTLSVKTQRTKEENERLAEVMKRLATAVPDAVAGFDEYGKVLDISIGKVRKLSTEHKEAIRDGLEVKIDEAKKQIEEIDKQFAAARQIVDNKTYTRSKTITVGGQLVVTGEVEEVPYTQSEINAAKLKAEDLALDRAKLVDAITAAQKILKGIADETTEDQNDQTVQLTELSSIVSDITQKTAELNSLQSQQTWTDAEKEKIKTLTESLKGLKDEYESLTGRKWANSPAFNFKIDKIHPQIDVSGIDFESLSLDGYLQQQLKDFDNYQKAYGSFLEKREALTREYNRRMAEAVTEGEKLTITAEYRQAIFDLESNAEEATSAISKLFGDMRDKTITDLRTIADEAEQVLQFLQTGKWDADTGIQLGIDKDTFDFLSKSPEQLKAIADAIRNIREEADANDNAFNKLQIGLKDIFNAKGDSGKLQKALANIDAGVGDILQSVGFLSDTLANLGDAFGNETLTEISEGITSVMNVASSAMQGAKVGSIFGGAGAAIGATIGLVSSLATEIAKIHDSKKQKNIERLQDQIDGLTKSYNKLGDTIEGVYSTEAAGYIEKQNRLLEQQKALIIQQIEEEKSKKDPDDKQIQSWYDELDSIDQTISDNINSWQEAITGISFDSFRNNFLDTLIDMDSSAEDFANDFEEYMQRAIYDALLAEKYDSKLKSLYEKMAEYGKNGYTKDEIDELRKEAENITADMLAEREAINAIFGFQSNNQDESSRSSTAKGIAQASQESIDALSGTLTATEGILYGMNENLSGMAANSRALLAKAGEIYETSRTIRDIIFQNNVYLAAIRDNTNYCRLLENMQVDMRNMRSSIDMIATRGVVIKN